MTTDDPGRAAATLAPHPRFWAKLPVLAGNLLQLAGVVAGALLIVLAAAIRGTGAWSTLLLVVGLIVIYLCSHAIAHWLIGRLVGLRFAYIGLRGTDHPEAYPPGIRQLMAATPMFTTVSTRRSRALAGRWALAMYYAAGETSTLVCMVLAAVIAFRAGIPGSLGVLVSVVLWMLFAGVTAAIPPKGDYAKARRALGAT